MHAPDFDSKLHQNVATTVNVPAETSHFVARAQSQLCTESMVSQPEQSTSGAQHASQ